MFIRSSIESKLDEEILSSLERLDRLQADSEEYGTVLDRIAKLHKLKTEERFQMPSLDTALMVGANIFGIIWLTRYEREHPLTSKALGFVMRPR
jgi:hypothetical protein